MNFYNFSFVELLWSLSSNLIELVDLGLTVLNLSAKLKVLGFFIIEFLPLTLFLSQDFHVLVIGGELFHAANIDVLETIKIIRQEVKRDTSN